MIQWPTKELNKGMNYTKIHKNQGKQETGVNYNLINQSRVTQEQQTADENTNTDKHTETGKHSKTENWETKQTQG